MGVPGSVPPGAVSRKRAGRRPRRQGTAASGVFCRRASGAWRAGKRACGSWEIGRPTGVRLRQAAHSGASCRAAALCRAACWCIDGERSWPRTLARYKGRCVGHQMRRPLWSQACGAVRLSPTAHHINATISRGQCRGQQMRGAAPAWGCAPIWELGVSAAGATLATIAPPARPLGHVLRVTRPPWPAWCRRSASKARTAPGGAVSMSR